VQQCCVTVLPYAEGLCFASWLFINLCGRIKCSLTGFTSLGEDLENESLHLHSTGLHCAALGGEIYGGILGLPLRPDHDSAIATLRASPLLP